MYWILFSPGDTVDSRQTGSFVEVYTVVGRSHAIVMTKLEMNKIMADSDE